MNLLTLTLAYLRARVLTTGLNLVLLALGVATIVVLILFGARGLETHQLTPARALRERRPG